jgi:outer membrane murein-binding lipoprotein Lpp
MHQKAHLEQQRRKYIRLDSVFPVQFRILSLDGKRFLSDWLQGFTSNIGKGGICLSVNNLNQELAQILKNQQAKLSLEIEMPVTRNPISALAKVTWVEDAAAEANRYLIGLSYEEIDRCQNSRIVRYTWTKKVFAPFALLLIVLLALGFALDSVVNLKLIQGNKALVEQLVKVLQESSIAKQKIKEIAKDRQDLQLKIQALQLRIQTLEEEKEKKENIKSSEIKQLNSLLDKLSQEKGSLQEELIAIQLRENVVTEDLLRLDKRKATLEKANLDKMYKWLKVHQNQRTGLVMSFEGDNDIAGWAFTYDQSLAIQAYTNYSDLERARKLLDFFQKKAKRIDGRFLNAYYVLDGSPAEYVVHSGPNIWLGIAALQYTKKTQDYSYFNLAEGIAEATIYLQNQDPEGGIRGGPNLEWYATEHNLDAYSFFNMLYKMTKKQRYAQARDKVLSWLVNHTYDKIDIPIKRGKGDSTIATDTYAWSIAAIGPEKLEELGMNPDRIIEFAEENCSVEVSYARPEGKSVKIKGFDFAPQKHLARGGVVSSEWTAQMVLAFKIMADFYYNKGMIAKARAYELKADIYLAELGNMIISSPSPSGQGETCLPYATQDCVDTGHGWMTPKGNRTGSVAGTAYTIFAYYKYNPLELKE